MKSLMFAWVGYQRRADVMRGYWGYKLVHLPKLFKSPLLMPVDYIARLFLTIKKLHTEKPEVVWLQLPPSFILHFVLLYKLVFLKKFRIVVDGHNSLFRAKWIEFPFTKWCLEKADMLLVHNADIYEEAISIGLSKHNIFVLEDCPFELSSAAPHKQSRPFIVFPCSFDVDEPIDKVIAAAELLPEVDFYVSGRYEEKLSKVFLQDLPENVKFTGYLPKSTFEALICGADAVLGLTTRDSVQLSVANEGVSAGRPLVLSNTKTLRTLYGECAIFVDNDSSQSMAAGLQEAISQAEKYESLSKKLGEARHQRWLQQAGLLMEKIQ